MTMHPSHTSDLRGLNRLTIDAIVGVTQLVEAVHLNILKGVSRGVAPVNEHLSDATSVVYRAIGGITDLVGTGIDALLKRLAPLLGKDSAWPGRDALLAALNGVLGDHLEATHNPLSIRMALRVGGQSLKLEPHALMKAIPNLNGRILVLAHGLCRSDLQWLRNGHDHGAALARDRSYTPIYLYYNSGLHVSTNGIRFDELMEELLLNWPVPVKELVILAHSMGGLVSRSAIHYGVLAGHRWPGELRKVVFLGTPHHGAPLERSGNKFHAITDISPYTAPFSNLGKIRSAGITDLRYGNLLQQDWVHRDRFARSRDRRTAVPLPAQVQCYAMAATTGKKSGDFRDRLIGDGLVPLESALGRHKNPRLNLVFAPENQCIEHGTSHLDLLDREEVYQQLLQWL